MTFDATLLDSQNNETIEPVFDIFFDVSKLKSLEISNDLTFFDYLRNANISIRQLIGHDIIETWCAADNNEQGFKNICG